jgi:putative transposase
VLIHKTFKFRIYPDKSTIDRLIQWNFALIWFWNLANEQRKLGHGRPKDERIYPTAFDQGKELTQLRKEVDWLSDVPRHACESILDRLDKAWTRCFNKTCFEPRWKKKKDAISIVEYQGTKFSISRNRLKFPKLTPIPIIMSRPLEGKPKSCTIKRDGDQWFACIVCEVNIGTPESRTEAPVGIDRGVRNLIADSNDRLVTNPKFLDKSLKKLARAQRAVSRKIKGSSNREKAKNKVSRIHRTVRRQREHFLHVESTRYAKSHGIVVLEELKTKNMIRVGGGLSRNIGDSGWGMFAQFLDYKLKWSGGILGLVNPAYTSQTCSACNHVDKASRVGDRFKCTKCGHTDHADTNGAKIVLARWSPACQPVEGSSQRAPRRSRKSKSVKVDLVD